MNFAAAGRCSDTGQRDDGLEERLHDRPRGAQVFVGGAGSDPRRRDARSTTSFRCGPFSLPMTVERATRASWKSQPMPEARARIPFARSFDRDRHRRVTLGLVPREMEDKWFVFFEEPWLWLHRSWTGVCIYGVRLRAEGEGSVVEEAWVDRKPDEYRETDDAHDVALLSFLVDSLLLGLCVPFPVRVSVDPAKAALLMHHVVGHARSNDDE